MQTFTVEYLISDLIDGVTPSPAFIPENEAPSGPTDPEELEDVTEHDDDNIYRFNVTNLGLIDPDFGTGGTFGDRFIDALWIQSPTAGLAASTMAVLSTRTRETVQEFIVPSLVGLTDFYREGCIFVPQGSVLGINGFDASADPDDIVVRMRIKAPDTLEEYAQMLESCCCTSLAECEAPTFSALDTTSVACGAPAPLRTITMTGSGFTENTTVEILTASCAGGDVSISDVTILSDTELSFLVTCDAACTVSLRVSNGPGCELDIVDAFSTTLA